jgi:hypothetical protein
VEEGASAPCPAGLMVLLGTVYEPHIIHPMQGPLKVPSLVQAVVGYPGVEVEAGSLAAGEAPVVRDH